MSYSGTTATTPNPPAQLSIGALTKGSTTGSLKAPQLFGYRSTNHTTDITASSFFSDGYNLGMRPGDILLASYFSSVGSTQFTVSLCTVISVSTSGGATVAGSTVASST